jgi:hypothetical protein
VSTGPDVFERVCAALERESGLRRIEARGTVRLVLKEAGLEPKRVTPEQMAVVLERLMPEALSVRKVADAEAVCTALVDDVRDMARDEHPAVASAYDVFRRLGRDDSGRQ